MSTRRRAAASTGSDRSQEINRKKREVNSENQEARQRPKGQTTSRLWSLSTHGGGQAIRRSQSPETRGIEKTRPSQYHAGPNTAKPP